MVARAGQAEMKTTVMGYMGTFSIGHVLELEKGD